MTGEEKLQTTCVLRLFGVSALRVQQAAAGFPAAWQVQAQCRSRGAETLLALDAGTASGLKKAQQSLQACFSAALYGTGSTSLSQAAVQALEQHHKLLVCSDAASGTLLETRLEAVPGAEKVFDFGRMSYADAKTNALLEAQVQRRTRSDHAADRTLARVQAAQRLVGVEFAAGCLKQSNARFLLVLGTRKGCWLRTVYAADAPALWLLDMIRRLRSAAGRGHPLAALPGPGPGGRSAPGPCCCGVRPVSCTKTAQKAPAPSCLVGAPAAGCLGGSGGLVVHRRRPCRPAPVAAFSSHRYPAPRRSRIDLMHGNKNHLQGFLRIDSDPEISCR